MRIARVLLVLALAACGARTGLGVGSAAGDSGAGDSGGEPDAGDSGGEPDAGDAGRSRSREGGACTASTGEGDAPLYLHVLLDASGSMMAGSKWTAVSGALRAFVAKLATREPTDPSLGLGLFAFGDLRGAPGQSDEDDCSRWETKVDAVTPAHGAALQAHLRHVVPYGGTAMSEAIGGQLPLLRSFAPLEASTLRPNGTRVLVLVTDGVADRSELARRQILDLVGRAARAPGADRVLTVAVGIGDPSDSPIAYDEQFLGQIAVAGGTAPPGCDPNWSDRSPPSAAPCHVQVTPGSKSVAQLGDELLAAFEAIRRADYGCLGDP